MGFSRDVFLPGKFDVRAIDLTGKKATLIVVYPKTPAGKKRQRRNSKMPGVV